MKKGGRGNYQGSGRKKGQLSGFGKEEGATIRVWEGGRGNFQGVRKERDRAIE